MHGDAGRQFMERSRGGGPVTLAMSPGSDEQQVQAHPVALAGGPRCAAKPSGTAEHGPSHSSHPGGCRKPHGGGGNGQTGSHSRGTKDRPPQGPRTPGASTGSARRRIHWWRDPTRRTKKTGDPRGKERQQHQSPLLQVSGEQSLLLPRKD